jgi:hypothetical protein
MKYMLSVTVAGLLTAFSVHSASAQSSALANADVTRLVAMRVAKTKILAKCRARKPTVTTKEVLHDQDRNYLRQCVEDHSAG